jgi:acyl-CoA thioester hydrolase
MARSDFRFGFPKRVRYAEVDAQAVVFNSRYLEYFDIGLTEYWRAVGIYEDAPVTGGPEFHVARAEVQFRAPMLLDEMIRICVACTRIGRTSMTFAFELHGTANGDEDLRATGEEVQVHVAEVRGVPSPVPDWMVAKFEAYEGRALR